MFRWRNKSTNLIRVFVNAISIVIIVVSSQYLFPVRAQGGTTWEPAIRIPSPINSNSWFPDVATDSQGNVHVVWCETGDLGKGSNLGEALLYSTWNGEQWTQYTDIVPPQTDIVRNAITISEDDTIHLTHDYQPPFSLYHKNASVTSAFSAANWSSKVQINGRLNTYMSDIVAWKNNLHIVYDDGQFYEKECFGCADIFYRRSEDGGITWTEPVVLVNTKTGSARAQIEVDQTGNIYVAWDEGWDRLTGLGSSEFGIFMMSRDQGKTWSLPLQINYPGNSNIQLTPAGDGKGGVMLVWRTISPQYPAIYYSWSNDWGQSWTIPQTLPNIASSQIDNSFDIYDMAVDGDGHIHLVATGYLASSSLELADFSRPPGVYHFEWDGNRWTIPELIYQSNWYPFYLKISITNGNQLNVVWYMKEGEFAQVLGHQIWFAHGESSAQFIPSEKVDLPKDQIQSQIELTATPVDLIEQPNPIEVNNQPGQGNNPYSEIDEYLIFGVALVPVLILVLIVMRRRDKRL